MLKTQFVRIPMIQRPIQARHSQSLARQSHKIKIVDKPYRISGHESFPCRYTWLPKAMRGLQENSKLFSNEEDAMVSLGVGKNMVRSIRFWSQVSGVAVPLARGAGHEPTPLGRLVLGDGGLDPFFEDIRTLWLIHWNLSTDIENPLLAWDYLLNRWHEIDLVPSRALGALKQEASKQDDSLSMVTLEQHFETFLHTYIPTRGRKGEVQEDNLDCPLIELGLLAKVGEREIDRMAGRREPIYNFNREDKPEITSDLFVYCLNDFWRKRHPTEETLAFREVAHGHGSPGQIFKLSEEDIRLRVERLARDTENYFSYTESAVLQQIRRNGWRDQNILLNAIYTTEAAYA
jgi:hypothetical protein